MYFNDVIVLKTNEMDIYHSDELQVFNMKCGVHSICFSLTGHTKELDHSTVHER